MVRTAGKSPIIRAERAASERLPPESQSMSPTPPDRTPIAALKGVGAQTVGRLEKLGLVTVQDLVFHLPYRYEDRTRITPLGSLQSGAQALVEGRVELVEMMPSGRRSLVLRISDGTGFLNLRFFHFSADQRKQFERGRWLRCYGEAREGYYGLEMAHPDYRLITEAEVGRPDANLTPVYPTTEGLHQNLLRKLAGQALAAVDAGSLRDWLPEPWPAAVGRLGLADALRLLHQPPPGCGEASAEIAAARRRLAFEELLAHHLSLSRFRARMQAHAAPELKTDPSREAEFLSRLPFALTDAQRRVIAEIAADLARPRPMMRLVQGDVGSGKTVVAACAARGRCPSGPWPLASPWQEQRPRLGPCAFLP